MLNCGMQTCLTVKWQRKSEEWLSAVQLEVVRWNLSQHNGHRSSVLSSEVVGEGSCAFFFSVTLPDFVLTRHPI